MLKMKQVLCLFLVICFAVSLCACGNKPATNDNAPGNSTGNSTGANIDSNEKPQVEDNKLTAENVAGAGWQCTYHTGDDKIYTRFVLADDGTYKQIIAKNGLFDHSETGTYEVKGGKLYLYLNGDTNSATAYEPKGENLLNNGNEYTPYSE